MKTYRFGIPTLVLILSVIMVSAWQYYGNFARQQASEILNYQCSDELNALDGFPDETYPAFWDAPLDREILIDALGFDSPELFNDYDPDPILGTSVLIECSLFGENTYIVLVYPTQIVGWRMQIIHFSHDMRTITTFSSPLGTRVMYDTGAILGDINQNGLPDFKVIGYDMCNFACGAIWIVEHEASGQFTNISPLGSYYNGTEEHLLNTDDWNADGLTDITTRAYASIGDGIPSVVFYLTYSWNGQAYTLISISTETNNTLASDYQRDNLLFCPEEGETLWDDPAYKVSSDMFATLYYYHYLHDDIETAWFYVNSVVDRMIQNCDNNAAMQDFMNEMEIVRLYFQEE